MTEKENQNSTTLKFKYSSDKLRKSLLKSNKTLNSSASKQKSFKKLPCIEGPASQGPHPTLKYLFGSTPSEEDHRKFARLLYQGLFYSVCSLKGPSQEYIRKKSVRLPERVQAKQKFLMLDLDETLIHSVWKNEPADMTVTNAGEQIRFNVRPHCQEFLERLSAHFEIYLFTASTADYAQPIVNHLNGRNKFIQGLLHRNHCMETQNGLRIKDLRIIRNRSLSDIVIVDNLVHSFGLQIDNGIPILEFRDNKEDTELIGLEKILMEVKEAEDVRAFLNRKLKLKKCLDIPEEEFVDPVRITAKA